MNYSFLFAHISFPLLLLSLINFEHLAVQAVPQIVFYVPEGEVFDPRQCPL